MSGIFEQLVAKLREISDLQNIEGLLGWDQQTYMPPKGNDARSRHIALLSALAHQKTCDPQLGQFMDDLAADASLNEEQQALLREAKHDRDKAVKVPTDLVHEIAETAGQSHAVWVEARGKNDFNLFAPYLKKLIDLKKREAEAIGYPSDGQPYDVLLDNFEPGATVDKLNPVITETREICRKAVQAITAAPKQPHLDILKRFFGEDGQEKFGTMILPQLGYDLQAGRLDRSVHPFTSGFDVNDVRITTRYQENWLPASVFGIIHETGHALYEQGLPVEHVGTPLAQALSLGFHESQSRFWENQIGRSLPFWEKFYPALKQIFPTALSNTSLEEFYFAINTVVPSLVRVEADEVTYNLHIVVRYEVEQAMFNGQVPVDDLPDLWNQKMEDYLGLRPASNAEGILQDIHWSFGGFGYFPTYLLGNLYAAQWTAALRKDMPDLDAKIRAADFIPIRDWMREKIHRHGRRYTADELCTRITGETLNPDHFGQYLKDRFAPLYNITW